MWVQYSSGIGYVLQRHPNEHDGISNYRHLDCLLNRLFWHRSKKTSKLCITDICEGNSLVTGEFPTQRASNAENVSISWHHHELHEILRNWWCTVYPKKYAHGFCFAVLCCGYTLTDFPISIRLTSLALWQSNDCPSASKATLMNMDKYFMLIHYEWLHNHNKAKHNKTVCIFPGIYCNCNNNKAKHNKNKCAHIAWAILCLFLCCRLSLNKNPPVAPFTNLD